MTTGIVANQPVLTLASALSLAHAHEQKAAQAVVADPFSPDAIVELQSAGHGVRALAAAFRSTVQSEGRVLDLLA